METIGISCSKCNTETEAFKLSDIAAECTRCSTVHTITDEPVFITRSITPLHDIMEQRAKEQALEDMRMALLFNGNVEIPTGFTKDEISNGIDWSTCFDTSRIEHA